MTGEWIGKGYHTIHIKQIRHLSPAQRSQPDLLLPSEQDRKHIGESEVWPVCFDEVELRVFGSLACLSTRMFQRTAVPATS